jgi:hypothetical protein
MLAPPYRTFLQPNRQQHYAQLRLPGQQFGHCRRDGVAHRQRTLPGEQRRIARTGGHDRAGHGGMGRFQTASPPAGRPIGVRIALARPCWGVAPNPTRALPWTHQRPQGPWNRILKEWGVGASGPSGSRAAPWPCFWLILTPMGDRPDHDRFHRPRQPRPYALHHRCHRRAPFRCRPLQYPRGGRANRPTRGNCCAADMPMLFGIYKVQSCQD